MQTIISWMAKDENQATQGNYPKNIAKWQTVARGETDLLNMGW